MSNLSPSLKATTSEAADITHVYRLMRGGSQAHLVKASDGRVYVAKFAGNPQGNRTLINEWIGHSLFRRLGITTPELRILRLSESLVESAKLTFTVGNRRVPVSTGLHLGSQCPADPATTAVFDFLPEKFLPEVINLDDFARAFVADKLLGQTDSRQCIFLRERGHARGNLAFRSYMIDHGWIFAGHQWKFYDASNRPMYWHSSVYSMVDMPGCCQQTLRALHEISELELQEMVANIPNDWFADGDRDVLVGLLAQVHSRIQRLDSLLRSDLVCHTSRDSQASEQRERSRLRFA
jgi:HipA-like kinase